MANRRRYSAKQRAEAVGIAVVAGQTAASEQTGIPKQTIDYWVSKPEFGHLRTRAQEEFAGDLYVGMQVGVVALTQGLQDAEVPLRDKASAFVALADRYALLTGQATARTESRSLTEGWNDHERTKLRDILDGALAAATSPAEGDPG